MCTKGSDLDDKGSGNRGKYEDQGRKLKTLLWRKTQRGHESCLWTFEGFVQGGLETSLWLHAAETVPLQFIGRPVSAQSHAEAALRGNTKIVTLTEYLHPRHGIHTSPIIVLAFHNTLHCHFNQMENRPQGGSVNVLGG